jgi:hypothetical protein
MERLFFTVSSENKADDVASRIGQLGFKLDDRAMAANASSVDEVVHSNSELIRQTKFGWLFGAMFGWHVGLALIIFIGSPALYQWGGAVLIPIGGALGWSSLGAIVGGSGLFSRSKVSPRLEDHFEREVGQGRILISLDVPSVTELDPIVQALHQAGADEVYSSGKLAA